MCWRERGRRRLVCRAESQSRPTHQTVQMHFSFALKQPACPFDLPVLEIPTKTHAGRSAAPSSLTGSVSAFKLLFRAYLALTAK